MPRKKATDQEALLTFPVRTRLPREVYERLEKLRKESDCRSLGELFRRILSNEKITVFHKDASLDGPMEKLLLLQREIRAIGVNLNQVTRYFHSTSDENRKAFYAMQIAAIYKDADLKINLVLSLISQLSGKWLQK